MGAISFPGLLLVLFAASNAAYIPSDGMQVKMFKAIKGGNIRDVSAALKEAKEESQGLSINFCFTDPTGLYPFEAAGEDEVKFYLLNHGATNRCHFDHRYRYPATAVIRLGKFDELFVLLEKNPSLMVGEPGRQYNIISEICRSSQSLGYQMQTLERVIREYDPDRHYINTPDCLGYTPLGHLFTSPVNREHLASALLGVLLKHGANLYVLQMHTKKDQTSPFENLLEEYKDNPFFLEGMIRIIGEAGPIPKLVLKLISKHVTNHTTSIRCRLIAAEYFSLQ